MPPSRGRKEVAAEVTGVRRCARNLLLAGVGGGVLEIQVHPLRRLIRLGLGAASWPSREQNFAELCGTERRNWVLGEQSGCSKTDGQGEIARPRRAAQPTVGSP